MSDKLAMVGVMVCLLLVLTCFFSLFFLGQERDHARVLEIQELKLRSNVDVSVVVEKNFFPLPDGVSDAIRVEGEDFVLYRVDK